MSLSVVKTRDKMSSIKRIQLDLSHVDRSDSRTGRLRTSDSILKSGFRRNGIYEDGFLFTVIDGERLDEFLQKGTYRSDDVIFAFTKRQLKFYSDDPLVGGRTAHYRKPAIAVYRALHFAQVTGHGNEHVYRFLNPDKKQETVEAVVEVTW